MSEWRKYRAYYVEFEDGRTLIQLATSKEDASVNARFTLGRHLKVAVVRRATKDDIEAARKRREVQP